MSDRRATPPDRLRADAIVLLRAALEWRLPRHRWDKVAGAVAAMGAARRGGDVEAFRDAASDLELAGPERAHAVGDEPVVPPPDPVRPEINDLIVDLDGPAPPE